MAKNNKHAYRQDTNRRKDGKKFTRTARKVHKKNISPVPMRGGIRL